MKYNPYNKALLIFSILLWMSTYVSVGAIEYGGLGGKPAYPDPENPRTSSIFLFDLEPGETGNNSLQVVNNTQETKTILIYPTDSQKSTDGSFACEQHGDDKDSVGSWIQLETSEVTLEPLTNTIVPFTINIPENASVGEQNGCIMMQEKKGSDSNATSGVSLSFRTGIRVVVTVPGEQVRKLELKEFIVDRGENGITLAIVSVENQGNVSIDSKIKVNMNYLWGSNFHKVDNAYPILRGETSQFNFEMPKAFWGGLYRLDAEVEYDPSNESSIGVDSDSPNEYIKSKANYTFVFPSLVALIIEIIGFALIGWIIWIIIERRKHDQLVETSWVSYIVKEEDDINSLSKKFNVSWQELAKVNDLEPPYQLKKRTRIKVPPMENSRYKKLKLTIPKKKF